MLSASTEQKELVVKVRYPTHFNENFDLIIRSEKETVFDVKRVTLRIASIYNMERDDPILEQDVLEGIHNYLTHGIIKSSEGPRGTMYKLSHIESHKSK